MGESKAILEVLREMKESIPPDECAGHSASNIAQEMEEVRKFIALFTLGTATPEVTLRRQDSGPRGTYTVKAGDEVDFHSPRTVFVFERKATPRTLALIRVFFSNDNDSVKCMGHQHGAAFVHLTDFADIRAFVARRLAPRICCALTAYDQASFMSHVVNQSLTPDKQFKVMGMTNDKNVMGLKEHDKKPCFEILKTVRGRVKQAVRVRLVGQDKLLVHQQQDDGSWKEHQVYNEAIEPIDVAQMAECDMYGDGKRKSVEIVAGQLMFALGMRDLFLPKEQLPPSIQQAIAAWTDPIDFGQDADGADETEVGEPARNVSHSEPWHVDQPPRPMVPVRHNFEPNSEDDEEYN